MTGTELAALSLEDRRAVLGAMGMDECIDAGYCDCGLPLAKHPPLRKVRLNGAVKEPPRPTVAIRSFTPNHRPVDDGSGRCTCGRRIGRWGGELRHAGGKQQR